jgi:hypothetical protein
VIVTPTRRIWLYPAPDGALEILILGDDEGVAAMYARIRKLAESWRGFDRVAALAQSGAVLGVRVTLSIHAQHDDPVAEGILALLKGAPDAARSIAWRESNGAGMVGTW